MHSIKVSAGLTGLLEQINPWAPSADALDSLAAVLGGARLGGWLRTAGCPAVIIHRQGDKVAAFDRGCLAERIPDELETLDGQVRQIRAAGGRGDLCAAAFFHLKLVRIHPLRDFNGRTARSLLARQLSCGLDLGFAEALAALEECRDAYIRVFRTRDLSSRFELMVDLIARTFGFAAIPELGPLSSGLNLRFPDHSPELKRKLSTLLASSRSPDQAEASAQSERTPVG